MLPNRDRGPAIPEPPRRDRYRPSTSGVELYGTAIDAEGTLTVNAVGECIGAEIDYADEEKSISGTFNAPVRPL